MPVSWEELSKLTGGDQWNVATVHTRLDVGNSSWEGYDRVAVSLAKPMKALGFVPKGG